MKENSLQNKINNSILTAFSINENGAGEKVVLGRKENKVPISGLDLLKYCASSGARIENFEDINLENNYYVHFIGFMSYKIELA
jgi:hypothetical protein